MQQQRDWLSLGVLALTVSCTAASNSSTQRQQSQQLIKVDGSSTVFQSRRRYLEFQKQDRQCASKRYFSGTTGGFKSFVLEKQTSATLHDILTEEMAACNKGGVRYIELPLPLMPLQSPFIRKNWAKDITVGELKKIWEPAAQEKSPVGSKFVRLGLIDRLTCMVQVISLAPLTTSQKQQ